MYLHLQRKDKYNHCLHSCLKFVSLNCKTTSTYVKGTTELKCPCVQFQKCFNIKTQWNRRNDRVPTRKLITQFWHFFVKQRHSHHLCYKVVKTQKEKKGAKFCLCDISLLQKIPYWSQCTANTPPPTPAIFGPS